MARDARPSAGHGGQQPRNTWARLQTATVNVFGDERQVLAEQVSTEISGMQSRTVTPLAFIFAVAGGRITRIRRCAGCVVRQEPLSVANHRHHVRHGLAWRPGKPDETSNVEAQR